MKLELPPPIPAKREFPKKVQPPPRNETSPSVKPLPAVPPPLPAEVNEPNFDRRPPPQASPPPLPPAPSTQAPSNEKAGTPAEWLVVGFTVLGLGLLIAWGISSSSTQKVPSNSGSYSVPKNETSPSVDSWEPLLKDLRKRSGTQNETPAAGTSTTDSARSPATASPTSESSPAPSPWVDEASLASQSPTTGSEPVQPTTEPPQTYRVIKVKRGDSLKVRTGPGQTEPVVTTLGPGTRGILLFSERIPNGSTVWQKIWVGGYAGWVNEIYLEADFPSAVPRAVEVR